MTASPAEPSLPFEDSRRLTGANLFFASTGAVLDTLGVDVDDALIAAWSARTELAATALGWNASRAVVRRHARGVSLALTAPLDQLFTATEVNEWALCAALAAREPPLAATLSGRLN